MVSNDVNELREEVEKRLDNGDTFSVKEIRQIMKKYGLSYAQVVRQTKQLDRDIKKARAAAELEGKPFDKNSYLSQRMRKQ